MEHNSEKKPNTSLKIHAIRLAVVFLALIAAVTAMPAGAWFYFSRQAAVAGDIDNPIAIYINAGNKEEVRFIDLSSIDKTSGDHYDVVFSIWGKDVTRYLIQLAFTTNNQFEYEIYPAYKVGEAGTPAANPIEVQYLNRANVLETYRSTGDALAGHYLNLYDTGEDGELLAIPDSNHNPGSADDIPSSRHEVTYTREDDTTVVYNNVNQYAEPLYWHTNTHISVAQGSRDFCHYYILRVKWSGNAVNNKETDIIYISAKVGEATEQENG